MGERSRPNAIKSQARLRLVRHLPHLHRYGTLLPGAATEMRREGRGTEATMRGYCVDECLISSHDAVISKRLQEQTRVVLAMLTPREQLVLRLRFGIAQIGDQPLEKVDEMLTPAQIAFIEATALRKLRHPSQGARLRSVDRR